MGPIPYWRLSAFYFFYFATLGALLPYFGLYLQSIGFTDSQIGKLVALILATKIVAPNLWAWLVDRTGHCMLMVRISALLTLIAFSGVFLGKSFWWLALVMVLFSFFWNAALPQLEATTMNYLGSKGSQYGRIRMWGSIGFIVTVVLLGPGIDQYGPSLVLPALMVLMLGILVVSMTIPEIPVQQQQWQSLPFRYVFSHPGVLAVLFACLLMQLSHAPYYTYYSIYLQDLGYRTSIIGLLWALGVVAEIGIFLVAHAIFERYTLRLVLLLSFFLTALRWVLIAEFADSMAILFCAQLLHAITFGAYHAAAIQFVHRHFEGNLQHRGQALYSSISFGVGGALGSFYSSYAWGALGAVVTFHIAAVVALLAFAVVYFVSSTSRNSEAA